MPTIPTPHWPFPISASTDPRIPSNPWERREFCLAENAQDEKEVWVVAKELERRGQATFPVGWMAEIRVFYDSPSHGCKPRMYRVKCICNYSLGGSSFEMLILSPATSRPSLGCWIPRAFKVTG